MKRFLGGLWSFTKTSAQWGLFCCCVFVIVNAAELQFNYLKKYENSYDQMIREHEQQLVVGQLIQSQIAWEQSAETLRQAYLDERMDAMNFEYELEVTRHEAYAFFLRLEKLYPGVGNQIINDIGASRVNLFPDLLTTDEDGNAKMPIRLISPKN